MKTKTNLFAIIIIIFFYYSNAIFSQENVRAPFELQSFSISMLDLKEKTAVIEFSSNFISTGDVEVNLYLPDEFILTQGNKKNNSKRMGVGEKLNNQWIVKIPEEGYYLIEVNINILNQKSFTDEQRFTNYHSFPLYVEVNGSNILKYDYKQDLKFTAPTIEDTKEPRDKKPFAKPIPFDSNLSKIAQKVLGVNSYTITINISGQIKYNAAIGIVKGVPNVGVYLDWDYDNNINTGYTPYYGGNTVHVDYDVTDNNGNYYFNFSFQSDHPANYYSPRIRVYANNANSAAFDAELGIGAKFGVYHYLNIAGISTYVFSNSASITVDQYQGGSLRNLFRAKQFSINGMGFDPGTIRYFIRTSQNTSYFCGGGNCGNGINLSVSYILFNRIPDSHLGYHEYGHHVEYGKVGFTVGTGVVHSFSQETDIGTAWTEGWAEFFEAAAHNYYYSVELPSKLEYLSRGEYDAQKEFCDYSQSLVTGGTGLDNTKVEGAVACFFYSLLDGVSTRAPNYMGDNDDIEFSGSFILNNLANRYNILGQLLGSSHIESFKLALQNVLNTQQNNSVQAMYNLIISQNGIAKSATANTLNVSGNSSSRYLTWNDNSCPSVYSYPREGGFISSYNIVQNQEQGFRIYRKAKTESWDGTLNGYSIIGTVGQNVTSWNDNTPLTGNHSYVVVAYNNAGVSIPKAENSVYYPLVPPVISSFTQNPVPIYKGTSGNIYVNLAQGNGSLRYNWFSTNQPSHVSIDTSGDICQMTYLNVAESFVHGEGDSWSFGCTVSNVDVSGWTDTKTFQPTLNPLLYGCPTLAFDNRGTLTSENPLLITSMSNPGKDVTDYYLINTPLTANNNKINLTIYEPQREHTWFDNVSLLETRANPDETLVVNDEGQVINYKGVLPARILLNGETDITQNLLELDSLSVELHPGDKLTISRNAVEGDGDIVINGEEGIPIAKRIPAMLMNVITQKQGLENDKELITETVPFTNFFLRPNKSTISKKLRNLPTGTIEITVNKKLTLDYFVFVTDLRTSKTKTLPLVSAVHNINGDIKSKLTGIDLNYADLYPTERIDLSFSTSTNSGNIAYILKTVGRYETDTTFVGKQNNLAKINEQPIVPTENKLYDNYPNPFNPSTIIKYTLKNDGRVTLKIFNTLGEEIRTLVDELKPAGNYEAAFNASNLPSGVYIYRMQSGDFVSSKKMILIK